MFHAKCGYFKGNWIETGPLAWEMSFENVNDGWLIMTDHSNSLLSLWLGWAYYKKQPFIVDIQNAGVNC